ncbi:MAG TPA: hypothetical protein VN283_08120 [Thiobacillus sp.]|nr:hypothetical protein [Thiobacillus sp.]
MTHTGGRQDSCPNSPTPKRRSGLETNCKTERKLATDRAATADIWGITKVPFDQAWI